MASSPLVANINPLLDSLRQFTPAAREDRRLQLAGLGQAEDLRSAQIDASRAQLETSQIANKRAKILEIAETNRVDLLGDRDDIDFVIKDGANGIRNNIALLIKDKGDLGTEEMQEFIGVANMATENPEGAFKMLEGNRKRVVSQLGSVDEILKRTNAANLQKTASFLVRNKDGSTSIATGVFDPNTGELRTETTSFGADQLVSRLGETPGEQSARKASEAGGVAGATAAVELETKPQIAAATDAAKAGIKRSEQAFDSIAKIRTNIANLDEAIRLIDSGAETGAVSSLFPSFTAASVALDNLQGRLGLDVIGETTFGALSESELKFALDTALPTGLDGPALKAWLRAKKQSQQKLSTYLESVATFMGRGGTVADFLEMQKVNQIQQEAGPAPAIPEGTRIRNSTTGEVRVMTDGTWQPAP